MNNWVTIAYYATPVEIAVLTDRFDEEGIVFITIGGNSAYPPLSAVQGGIQIQVHEEDEVRALEIIKETGYSE